MCILYQMMSALTSFREWSVHASGSPHLLYKAGLYRGMTITHRHRLQNKDTVFLSSLKLLT